MSELQGRATFGTIEQIKSASITVTAGITPNAATIVMLPQAAQISEYSVLTFSFDGMEHRFIEAKADYGELTWDRSGLVWTIVIYDRRWKWKFGQIGGEYNVRNPDYTIKTETEKTPQELARLCLDAMGEDEWETGDLPNESRPTVRWDCDNPAQCLANLADELGCLVVPCLDERRGRIVVAGEGADLPSGGVLRASATFDPPETPSQIGVVCGPDRWEVDFELEPVGEDNDEAGTIMPIDELSYAPEDGWGKVAPGCYAEIFDDNDKLARECAEKSVWKWYRLKVPGEGIEVPGWSDRDIGADKPIKSLDCILLEDRLVGTAKDQVPGAVDPGGTVETVEKTRRKPAIIWGKWFHAKADAAVAGNYEDEIDPDDPDASKYSTEFSIDASRRMVRFGRCMFQNDLGGGAGAGLEPAAAEIHLRTACTLLDPTTLAPVRTCKWRETGAPYETDILLVKHNEIVLGHTEADPDGVNLEDVEEECDYYLDAIEEQYTPEIPQVATYMGLVRFDLDGAIRQVTYEVDSSGARTTVARNTEELHRKEPYRMRRKKQTQEEAVKQIQDARNAVDDRSDDVMDIA